MNKAYLLIIVRAQGTVIGVVSVGRHQCIFRRGWIAGLDYNWGVSKNISREAELNEIAWLQLLQRCRDTERAWVLRLSGLKIEEVLHAGPRRSFVIGVYVVPAKGGRKIHNTGARIETLGGKIGAIAANFLVIIIGRIAAKSPLMGIGHGSGAVIGNNSRWCHSSQSFPGAMTFYAHPMSVAPPYSMTKSSDLKLL